MKSKKGVTNIVTSSLLILLVIITASIIFYVVREKVDIQSSPEYSCFNLKLNPPIKIQSTCYNSKSGEVEVNLWYSESSINIDSLYFMFYTGEQDSVWTCGQSCGGCNVLKMGSSRKYLFAVNEFETDNPNGLQVLRLFEGKLNCELGTKKIEEC